jgi:hypothetical protein
MKMALEATMITARAATIMTLVTIPRNWEGRMTAQIAMMIARELRLMTLEAMMTAQAARRMMS